MELHEYPRPSNDTGIGVHWTVGFASAIGMGKIRDYWIPELKALGVKWVKIFNHDGAIDFAELLLAEGIMPIVRIFRPSPNPSTLDVREVVHLDAFIRAGVHYFEFNSEPDRDSEWKGGRVPANGLELVVDSTIANLETILERGGMPGVPAVANGSRWDLVGRIVAKGRKDLFNGPVWQAIHNYSSNRPLDYPYDIGNQEGAAFSQRFYEAVANSDWGEDPWRGRSLTEINRLRLDRANPESTIMDEHACWLAYEYFDARNRKHLGHSIPILSTECGYLVGEDMDPRYPATTPDLHMAQTLEACRIMMGTTTRFQPAPDYYFCTAFWLLGNNVLGSSSNWWEHHAWYRDKGRGEGALPIVRALKAEPKSVRQWQSGGSRAAIGARAMLRGTVSHAGEHRTLILEKNGQEIARATLDANSRYVIPDLLAGNYLLRIEGTSLEQPVSIPPEQEQVQVNLSLVQTLADVGGSVIEGRVAGGAGAVVILLRTSDGEDWVTMAKDDGSFRFVELAAGSYTLRAQGDGNTDLTEPENLSSAEVEVTLDGQDRQKVELAVPGWGYTIQRRPQEDNQGAIQCAVPGYAGLQAQAALQDWRSEPVTLGSAPEVGEFAGEIAPLAEGYYTLTVEGEAPYRGPGMYEGPVQLQAFVQVDHKTVPFVEFVYTPPEAGRVAVSHNSSIRGRIIGGYEPRADGNGRLYVWLMDQQANRREQIVGDDCTFAFEHLPPGLYSVEVSGYGEETRRADIALDGRNTVQVELMVPIEETPPPDAAPEIGAQSTIIGRVPEGAGLRARLVDSVGNERKQIVEPDHTFRFEDLPPGVYTVTVDGGYVQNDLTLDGANGLEVIFQPLEMNWEYQASPAGSMPGYSVIRVEVEGMRGLPVYIWKEDWEGMMRRTGSKPEYGECSAEFSPLGPGIYMVEPEGLDVYADVELTGLEVVWVDFRRRAVPASPHEVRPLAQGSRSLVSGAPDLPTADMTTGEDQGRSRPNYEGWESFASDAGEHTARGVGGDAPEPGQDEETEAERFGSLRFDRFVDDLDSFNAESLDVESGITPARTGGDWSSAPVAEEQAPPAPQESRYLYLAEQVDDLEDQIALLRYAAQAQPGVGQDIEEALRADFVYIVAPSLPPESPESPDSTGQTAGAAAGDTEAQTIAATSSYPDSEQENASAGHAAAQPADDLGDFDWGMDDDADQETVWPDWPSPSDADSLSEQSDDDSVEQDDLYAWDAPQTPFEPAGADATDAEAGAPDPEETAAEPAQEADDLYSAWLAASRRNDQSGRDAVSDAQSQSLSKGNEDNSPSVDSSAMMARDGKVLAQVQEIEARLQTAGVRFERLTGKLAPLLASRT